MRSLLRGSHTVPRTRFTAPSVWRPTPASFIALIGGLWLFGTGDALILASALGASPWSVLAQGLSDAADRLEPCQRLGSLLRALSSPLGPLL